MGVYLKFLKLFLVLMVGVFFLVGSGGGGGSDASGGGSNAEAKVLLENIELPTENKYYISTSKSTTEFDTNKDIPITTEKDKNEIVALTDEFGNIFLTARKLKGQSTVDISLDSTAETFVLMRRRFFGRTIKNENLLSERIRKNENFDKLKQELARRIKISPCPLNSECSPVASYIADKVANSLDLTDVIDEEK